MPEVCQPSRVSKDRRCLKSRAVSHLASIHRPIAGAGLGLKTPSGSDHRVGDAEELQAAGHGRAEREVPAASPRLKGCLPGLRISVAQRLMAWISWTVMSWVVWKVPSGRSPPVLPEPFQEIFQVTEALSRYGVPSVAWR
jgi:hypothetical protein